MIIATPEQVAKLPKWAQSYIESLERDLESTIATVRRFDDAQTESPIYCDDGCSNPRVKRFIPSPDKRIMADWAGVHVELFLPRQDDGQREFGPEIQWSAIDKRLFSGVALLPSSWNTIQLVAKENMR